MINVPIFKSGKKGGEVTLADAVIDLQMWVCALAEELRKTQEYINKMAAKPDFKEWMDKTE